MVQVDIISTFFTSQKADKNGDGRLSYSEYWNAIKTSGIQY